MHRGFANRYQVGAVSLSAFLLGLPLSGLVRAGGVPIATTSLTRTKIQIESASLSEAIDALARAAGFKVTYEGPRPGAMLFKTEIDTPSVSETLIRLLDGQNLNYAVVFDATGKKVSSLMVFGVAPRTGSGFGSTAPGGTRAQPFATPRNSRGETPTVDEEEIEAASLPEVPPEATPAPAPSPGGPPNRGPGAPGSPVTYPPSPFAPRPPFGSGFGPRATPPPTPPPTPTP